MTDTTAALATAKPDPIAQAVQSAIAQVLPVILKQVTDQLSTSIQQKASDGTLGSGLSPILTGLGSAFKSALPGILTNLGGGGLLGTLLMQWADVLGHAAGPGATPTGTMTTGGLALALAAGLLGKLFGGKPKTS